MKIAYLLPSLQNKGPIVVVRDLVRELIKDKSNSITVFYLDDITELEFQCETRLVKNIFYLDLTLFDIVHTHLLRPDVFIGMMRNKLKNTKVISTVHNYMYLDLNFEGYNKIVSIITRYLWLKMLSRFDKVICLSNDMKLFFSDFLNSDRLNVIYNGRNIPVIGENICIPHDHSEILEFKGSRSLIGVIANLRKTKGIEQLINVLPFNSEIALLIIGDGSEKEELVRLAHSINVENQCRFLGHKINVADYYIYLDAFAIPSRVEGLPLALLEAACYGLPTVCSNIPVFLETFDETEVVFFELDNIEMLNLGLKRALIEGERLSIKIKAKYIRAYTGVIMASNYQKLYTSLISNTE